MKTQFFFILMYVFSFNSYSAIKPIPNIFVHEPTVVWVTYNYLDANPSVSVMMEKRYTTLLQAYKTDAVHYNNIELSNLISQNMSIKIDDKNIEMELEQINSDGGFLEFKFSLKDFKEIGLMHCTYNFIVGTDTHAQVKTVVVSQGGTRTFTRKKEKQFIEVNL